MLDESMNLKREHTIFGPEAQADNVDTAQIMIWQVLVDGMVGQLWRLE